MQASLLVNNHMEQCFPYCSLSSNKMKDEGAHILAKALETNGTVVSLQ